MNFPRTIYSQIIKELFIGNVIVLYGPRQVGKTTLVKSIQAEYNTGSVYYQGDDPATREAFTNKSAIELFELIKGYKLVILDEAQNIPNIGVTLKLIVDNFPDIQVIATGSSSFDLANEINEPLTGRKSTFFLYPLSIDELGHDLNPIEKRSLLPNLLVWGQYPKIYNTSFDLKIKALEELSGSYLYKDILNFENLKYPSALEKLLQALAFQLGSEVSFNELANLLNVDQFTIQKYLDLLEKAFIIFKLSNFSRNLKTEIKKSRKYYFYDLGIRNSLIKNYNTLDLRQDIGALWENFVILERFKFLDYSKHYANKFFWRNYNNAEIDYIEEYGEKLHTFEIKYSPKKKAKIPAIFDQSYPNSGFKVINTDTFWSVYKTI